MRILQREDFKTMPWKNGGGITHEIAKREDAGKLVWRLSLADVASDGPFSRFVGMSRMLTVISGEGLDLHMEDRDIIALPFHPVRFSGDWPLHATRRSAVVEDFNVIFDGACMSADVHVWPANTRFDIAVKSHAIHACLLLGKATVNGTVVALRSVVVAEEGKVTINCEGPAVHVVLHAL